MRWINRSIAWGSALFIASAGASAAPVQIKITTSNGTGFYVSREGHVLTSNHVVPSCKQLSVAGDGRTQKATVLARDKANDLALLKTESPPMAYGRFSTFKTPLAKGDRAIVIGFPGASEEAVIRDSEIVSTDVPSSKGAWIGLGDVLEHGNSGGPVFDTSGNIIGVVAAKAVLYMVDVATRERLSSEHFGMAVAAPVVEKFLRRYRVPAELADTDIYLPTSYIESNARAFVVKVSCETKRETVG